MIYSAMIFALGVFVSGLLWLAFIVALVGRTRRITARRVLAGVSTRRAEFETERDALRARHAVEIHKVQREVDRVLDMATAYRLESDVKERDVVNMRAELTARDEDVQEMQLRLAGERDLIQDLERRHAEAGATLRAVQHALSLEMKRRAMADEAADAASIIADQQRAELGVLRAENETLRAILSERLPPEALPAPASHGNAVDAFAALQPPSGSVVPLPTRSRPVTHLEAPEAEPAEAVGPALDPQRLAGEVQADFSRAWRAPATLDPRMPVANGSIATGEAEVRRSVQASVETEPGDAGAQREDAETRFFEALAEIRALKRAASQAGE